MSLSKDEWGDGLTEERKTAGCLGCLLVVLACLVLDALTLYSGYQLVMLIRDIVAG